MSYRWCLSLAFALACINSAARGDDLPTGAKAGAGAAAVAVGAILLSQGKSDPVVDVSTSSQLPGANGNQGGATSGSNAGGSQGNSTAAGNNNGNAGGMLAPGGAAGIGAATGEGSSSSDGSVVTFALAPSPFGIILVCATSTIATVSSSTSSTSTSSTSTTSSTGTGH